MTMPARQQEIEAGGAFTVFALFHLNLAFSSIEEEMRGEVIARCYWPLLKLAEKCGPIGMEITGYTLEEIAAKEGMTLAKFLTTLHNEVLDHHGEVNNFASLLRCSCLIYRAKSAAAAAVPDVEGEEL